MQYLYAVLIRWKNWQLQSSVFEVKFWYQSKKARNASADNKAKSVGGKLHSNMSTSVSVPEGFSELLEEFAVTVLREKPADLLEFAAQYFNNLYMSRKEGASVSFQGVSEQASTAEVEMTAEGDWPYQFLILFWGGACTHPSIFMDPCFDILLRFWWWGLWASSCFIQSWNG